MNKKFNSPIYVMGTLLMFRRRGHEDTEYLYSWGKFKTKIKPEDLPEDYLQIRSRSTEYLDGYLRVSGIKDMVYTYMKENHVFKDDYIYISYDKKISSHKEGPWGFKVYDNWDLRICGNDIINIVLAAEKFSNYNTKGIKKKIAEKIDWLKKFEPEFYKESVRADKDIFTYWIEKGFVDKKVLKRKYFKIYGINKDKSLY